MHQENQVNPLDPPAYEELLAFFNESPDLFCIAGFDGRFKRLNPAWQAALGWTLEELLARPFLDFVLPGDHAVTLVEMDRLATGATTICFENRYCGKDGTCRWLQWTASPLPGRREIYAIARDVTRQKTLEQEILGTLDRERERVGQELHDGLCQDLAAIAALNASLVRGLTHAASPQVAAALEVGKLLRQSIRNVRDMARGVDPLHLEEIGLMAALEEFCSNTEALYQITCRMRCEDPPPSLDARVQFQLHRIAQEAVKNATTHGRATQIDVNLTFEGGRGRLAVQDDGVGIGDSQDRREGIGLHTMAYRASLIGASLEIGRRFPRGTVITCIFPLPPATTPA